MKRVITIVMTIVLIICLLPVAAYAADPDEYTLFYKDPETGEWMIQLIPVENILLNPFVRGAQFCDRLFRGEPVIDNMAKYYTDNKTIQFLSENKGLAAGGVALAGVVYIYIAEQPNRAKKTGATIKVIQQLRRLF